MYIHMHTNVQAFMQSYYVCKAFLWIFVALFGYLGILFAPFFVIFSAALTGI